MKCLKSEKQAPDISHLPKRPGVYVFKNTESTILYIGKAVSLLDRVKSYFNHTDTRPNIELLVSQIHLVDFIETGTEEEALLLEATLIQKQKPPFNVLIKEGNPFLYIVLVKKKDKIQTLELSRHKKSGICIGPFLYKKSVRALYEYVMREFQLKICHKKIKNGCLFYHIGQCAGSCKPDFDAQEYQTRLSLAISLLQKNQERFIALIEETIREQSKEMHFERAARFLYYKEHAERFFQTVRAQNILDKTELAVFAIEHTPPTHEKEYSNIETELQTLCGISTPLISIDCFDISHAQGRYMVGSAIRFASGKAVPAQFRRFLIKTVPEQNDYAALAEIVTRRYKKGTFPDLILIDGGKGQKSTIDALQLPVPIASLAKREERLFTNIHKDGIVLSLQSEVGRMLCQLRDYAHHFAVSYHQKRKRSAIKDQK